MSVSTEFHDLLARAEQGSQEAIWELVESLGPHVHRLVNKRMAGALRQRVGASDIVQATWASFLLRDRPLTEFRDEEAIRAYVSAIALNKLRMAFRSNVGTQARDLRRQSLVTESVTSRHVSVEPTVSEVFVFRESWDTFMESQPEHYRKIVQLRLEGLSLVTIGEQLRLNERTVRRVLQKLASAIAM